MGQKQTSGVDWSETATHATAAEASHVAATGFVHYVTDIAASSDKAGAILLVKDGTTTIWQVQVGAGSFRHAFVTPLRITKSAACSVAIDGTSACKANIAGFTL